MLSLLHISDLHFGPPYRPEIGEAVLRSASELRPDIVVASGDFTQRAKPAQFADARRFLDRLPPVPLVVVPGNHDIPLYRVFERLFFPYALYRQTISPELDSVVRHDRAVIAALNTTSPLRRITDGIVQRRHLDFCRQAFADAPPGAVKIVVAHHPFFPPPDYDTDSSFMPGTREALDCFTELQVELILGGHLHRAYIGNSLDVYPSTDRSSGIVIVQSGTTTSSRGRAREREKNSFNLIRIDDEVIRVTHYLHFAELGNFAPASCHTFPRRARHYLKGQA